MELKFRKAAEADSDSIINIISQAQAYFKNNGIDQWQNNYPNIDTVRDDIAHGIGYVLLADNTIAGTMVLSFELEKTYEKIYEGQWLSSGPYAAIHRIAVDGGLKGKGLASVMIGKVGELCHRKGIYSIKVDTHRKNLSMQSLLKKNGFRYCGIIYLEDGSERFAFERLAD